MQHQPLNVYSALVASGRYKADPVQAQAIAELNRVWLELHGYKTSGWWAKLSGRKPAAVKGLYLWGGVGRGKTWMMDLFYDSLPGKQKLRIHFHRFMARVHAELAARPHARDPLAEIAEQWAKQFRVLCFDEFFVSDIADAMLLSGLLQALFKHGVTLIATSNVAPDNLYRDGLQRAKFMPAIAALKAHTQSLHIDGERDYRLRILKRSKIYLQPLNEYANTQLTTAFDQMAGNCSLDRQLKINDRTLTAIRRSDGIIWFSFETLCEQPRSTADYIELARAFNTVFLSGVPPMSEANADATRRFINLIDEFYDRNVKLLISASNPIPGLYTGTRLAFEFQRTTSRLTEMQSTTYLAKPHLP